MRVSTRLLSGTGRKTGVPALWEVLLDGRPIRSASSGDASALRVLKMGPRYLTVIDTPDVPEFGPHAFATRRQAAEWLRDFAEIWSLV